MEPDVFPRINRVIVTGFIQQDPELRHTPSGVAVASFRVRSGRLVRDRRGVARETVSYFTVVVWQDLAQRICREAKIGQGVVVEGALHSRSFLTQSGERKTVVEIYADAVEAVPVFVPVRDMKAREAGAETNDHPDPERQDGQGMEEHPERAYVEKSYGLENPS